MLRQSSSIIKITALVATLIVSFVLSPVSAYAAWGTPVTFPFKGYGQTYIVPAGVTSVKIQAWGAEGGGNWHGRGGYGGYAQGILAVNPGQALSVLVGGAGRISAGGWNCGGTGNYDGGGGGASDVRVIPYGLYNRVIVAGGGGGGSGITTGSVTGFIGANGGGIVGGDGIARASSIGSSGNTGGTGSTGGRGYYGNGNGRFCQGGHGYYGTAAGAGGGGGWYGGGAGANYSKLIRARFGRRHFISIWFSGAGGSAYIGGVTGGTTTSGVRAGNGQIVITPSAVINHPPVVTFNSSNKTIILGQSVIYTSSATDQDGNMNYLALNWKNPDGTYNWSNPPGTGSNGAIVSSGPYFHYVPSRSSGSYSISFKPTSLGTYTIYSVANDPAGWVYSSSYTLKVIPPKPTATISVNPLTVDRGQATKVTWSSTNATSCTAIQGNFSTGGATSGTVTTGKLSTDTLYQIACTGQAGTTKSNIQQVTVFVPTVSLSAVPTRVGKGKPVTLNWDATNINSCTLKRNGSVWKTLTANAQRIVKGTTTDIVNAQTIYKLTCVDNASVSTVSTQIVNVTQTFRMF